MTRVEAPLLLTEPLGGSALSRAVQEEGERYPWVARPPGDAASWRARAIAAAAEFRASAWRRALEPALATSGAARARLERVSAAGGVVVTTGQQPGLFGGPLYTWWKALSALALADAVEAATGVPAAPLFWAATDDTDFLEASWTAVAVTGGVELLRLPPRAPEGRPMAETPLGDVTELLDALAKGAGSAPYGDALAAVRRAYAAGATVGGAFVALLREILHPLGVAVLDAAHPAVRDAARPTLLRALERARDVASALADRDREIERAGFAPQVPEVPGLSLVFESTPRGKRRVRLDEAASAARRADAALSPNVLLRPVVERAILPTVAYVAGPGELAYFAQVGAVARALGAPTPLAVPRWSGTVVEPHVARLLARYDLKPADLGEPGVAERRVARAALPERAARLLAALRREVERIAAELAAPDAAQALAPRGALEGARRTIEHRIDRLERRLLAAVKRREDDAMRAIATARGSLFPAGKRQERALNLIPLLARSGPPLLDGVRAAAGEHAGQLVGGGAGAPVAAAERAPA